MTILSVTYGAENGTRSEAKLTPIVHPTDGGDGVHIASMTLVGPLRTFPARNGLSAEEGGKWSQGTYSLEEGTIVRLTFWRKPSFGLPVKASVLIKMRATGPFHKISCGFLNNPDSVLTASNISGRFDIITLADASGMGAVIPSYLKSQFTDTEQAEAFVITVEEKEIAPQANVTSVVYRNEEGQEEVRLIRKQVRRIRVAGKHRVEPA
jgi:hypothetical protein